MIDKNTSAGGKSFDLDGFFFGRAFNHRVISFRGVFAIRMPWGDFCFENSKGAGVVISGHDGTAKKFERTKHGPGLEAAVAYSFERELLRAGWTSGEVAEPVSKIRTATAMMANEEPTLRAPKFR